MGCNYTLTNLAKKTTGSNLFDRNNLKELNDSAKEKLCLWGIASITNKFSSKNVYTNILMCNPRMSFDDLAKKMQKFLSTKGIKL